MHDAVRTEIGKRIDVVRRDPSAQQQRDDHEEIGHDLLYKRKAELFDRVPRQLGRIFCQQSDVTRSDALVAVESVLERRRQIFVDDRVFNEMTAIAVDHPLEAELGVFDDADRVITAYLSNDVKVGHRTGAVDVGVEMEPLADARTEARIKDIVEPARHREVVLRHVERGFIRARDLHSRAPRVVHQREKVVVDMIVRVKPQRKRIIYPCRQNAFISEFQRIRNDVPALVGIVQHKDCRARLSCDLGGAVGAIVRDDIDVEKFFGIVLTGYQIRDRRADHVLFVVSADQNAKPVLLFRNGKLLLRHPKQKHVYQLKQKRYAYYEQHHVVDVSQHVVKLLVPLHGFSPSFRRIGSRRAPQTCHRQHQSPM